MTTPYAVDDSTLTAAFDDAHERIARAEDRLSRVACAYVAAAVRDILTAHAPDAPFDAAHLRLIGHVGTHVLTTDGTYWTTGGEERRIEVFDLMGGLLGRVNQLSYDNRHIWRPMCGKAETVSEGVSYRLDLAQAAQLPDEVHTSPRITEIRERLAAATSRPWDVEEIVTDGQGGIVADGDSEAVHTDFIVTDADRGQVAEIAVNYDGPEDTETPAEDIAESRANARLIAHAPQDLVYLLAYLDHLAGGEDAEAAHLRGYCGDCGTALYTSTPSETPAALDGTTECTGSRLSFLNLGLKHVLRT